ncbi:acyl-CoA N-acyltransferase [Papiliotrema laurentii]|uniref:Acyl-CoA N-acyltransferase n=1 Tax=Papiliotrema laurentii TaxID=5418 RepID=A0AAD9FT71_PAPLA|nr:acyl-CoA N-acyltransferase [Papiliotrema laurentii]
MTHVNSYTPPNPVSPEDNRNTPAEQYDHHFVFPVKTLRSDRVELRPFVPSLHAQLLADGLMANPIMLEWLPLNVSSVDDILVWAEKSRRDPSFLYHAIYTAPPGPNADQTPRDQYVFAGGIGITNSSAADSQAEIGWIMILPEFQRTHVLSHAAGLVMHRILDDKADGGLGLRRCQWFTNSKHVKSQAAAHRLGFTHEGILRAHRVLLPGKTGARAGRKGEDEECASRDTWVASVYWEEWQDGVREHVDKLMARKE